MNPISITKQQISEAPDFATAFDFVLRQRQEVFAAQDDFLMQSLSWTKDYERALDQGLSILRSKQAAVEAMINVVYRVAVDDMISGPVGADFSGAASRFFKGSGLQVLGRYGNQFERLATEHDMQPVVESVSHVASIVEEQIKANPHVLGLLKENLTDSALPDFELLLANLTAYYKAKHYLDCNQAIPDRELDITSWMASRTSAHGSYAKPDEELQGKDVLRFPSVTAAELSTRLGVLFLLEKDSSKFNDRDRFLERMLCGVFEISESSRQVYVNSNWENGARNCVEELLRLSLHPAALKGAIIDPFQCHILYLLHLRNYFIVQEHELKDRLDGEFADLRQQTMDRFRDFVSTELQPVLDTGQAALMERRFPWEELSLPDSVKLDQIARWQQTVAQTFNFTRIVVPEKSEGAQPGWACDLGAYDRYRNPKKSTKSTK